MLAIRKETLKVVNPDTGKYEGIAAISGDKGESSYEVAKRNGYTGTEAEFLEEFVPDNILTSFESFKADNENVKTRLTTLETTVANLDVPDTSEDIATLQSDVSDLKTRMSSTESINSSQGTSISNLTTRMSTAEGNITNHGTRLTTAENKLNNIPATLFTVANNAGAHNSIYRGKDLTNVYTINQICQMISDGTFEDLFIGDYFDITVSTTYKSNEPIQCVICGFLENGFNELNSNAAIIMPRHCLNCGTTTLDDVAATSSTALIHRPLFTSKLNAYETAISNKFGSHLKTPNTTPNYGEVLFKIGEPSIKNVFGDIYIANNYAYYLDGEWMDIEFPIFRLNPNFRLAKKGTENVFKQWVLSNQASYAGTVGSAAIIGTTYYESYQYGVCGNDTNVIVYNSNNANGASASNPSNMGLTIRYPTGKLSRLYCPRIYNNNIFVVDVGLRPYWLIG